MQLTTFAQMKAHLDGGTDIGTCIYMNEKFDVS